MTSMKFLTARFKGRDEERREITAWASAPTLDRDKEIIKAGAWNLADFKKHPVLVLAHAYEKLWVGKITEISPTSDGLFFRAVFAKTAAAEEVWQLIKSTNMAAFSVGFLPIASENVPVKRLAPADQKAALAAGLTMDGSVRVYSKVELLEISVVSVPSNTSATLLSWKTLAKTAELRAALDEITISDLGPSDLKDWKEEITIEEGQGISENVRKILVERIKKILAQIDRIQAYLSEEKKKEIVIADLKKPDIEKDYLADVTEEQMKKIIERTIKENIEVAIAKVRGRVI